MASTSESRKGKGVLLQSSSAKKTNAETQASLLEKMKEIGGHDSTLLIPEMLLSKTDLSPKEARLLLPLGKFLTMDFLNEEEKVKLSEKPKEGIDAMFIVPGGKVHGIKLKERRKKCYALTVGWVQVVKSNAFRVGDKKDLWCFRSKDNDDQLCFTLVNAGESLIPPPSPGEETPPKLARNSTKTPPGNLSVLRQETPPNLAMIRATTRITIFPANHRSSATLFLSLDLPDQRLVHALGMTTMRVAREI
ncbi:unnamed protein product [Thlaspi arvense]|uniref:TF-B3 domain-containing protein n=1 Tax=Thlaspi arvense TaxID=13288 RepID=A0AAU9SB62_THLAR|nr:unnamed protein product [Thlaspi arvense]